ncbi:MAG: hypothetical protein ACQEVA_22005 [Myxococcota bacterium]
MDELRLTPGPFVNLLAKSSMVRAAQRTGAVIIVATIMGNHHEMVVATPFNNLDDFSEEFQRELSHKLNRLRGVKHTNFPERYKSAELGSRFDR